MNSKNPHHTENFYAIFYTMSSLWNITADQEQELLEHIRQTLRVQTGNKISLWPGDFLIRHNIVADLTEREVKILEVDVAYVLKKIHAYNPNLVFYGTIEDTRYDFGPWKGSSLMETVRIRKKNDMYQLTIKKKNIGKDLKEREEFEVILTNPVLFEEAFIALGLAPVHMKKKVRYAYELWDIAADLDLYETIPPLLEIEWANKERIWARIETLGLQDHKVVNWSARETLAYYKQRGN